MGLCVCSVNGQVVEMTFFSLQLARSCGWSTGALRAYCLGGNHVSHFAADKNSRWAFVVCLRVVGQLCFGQGGEAGLFGGGQQWLFAYCRMCWGCGWIISLEE